MREGFEMSPREVHGMQERVAKKVTQEHEEREEIIREGKRDRQFTEGAQFRDMTKRDLGQAAKARR